MYVTPPLLSLRTVVFAVLQVICAIQLLTSLPFSLPPRFGFFLQRYAARDAYVSYLLHGRISELLDPISRDAEDLHPGGRVRLYIRGGDDCAGEGCIVE